MESNAKHILESVQDGRMSVEEALVEIRMKPYEDLGYANVDLHRKTRQGVSEVIYGAGKTAEQIAGIAGALIDDGQTRVLITRIDAEKARAVVAALKDSHGTEMRYEEIAQLATIGDAPSPDGVGKILVVTGGTSDIPVAEEAAITAEMLGNEVARVYDVGVAGVHRTLAHMEEIMSASVIVAVAGMEGALVSLVAGLADCPVIAVPTSVGYGASFGGLAALLAMLNSCASGVSVVNIDNGFGAAYNAHLINHMR